MPPNFPPPATEAQQWLVNFILALDDSPIPVTWFEDVLSRKIPVPTSSQQPNGDIQKAYQVAHDILLDVEEDYRCSLREAAEFDGDLGGFEVPPMKGENGPGFEESVVESLPRDETQGRISEIVREIRWTQSQIVKVAREIAGNIGPPQSAATQHFS